MRLPPAWRWLSALSLAVPLTVAAQTAAPSSQAASSRLSAADIARLSQDANQRVVVILRDQHLGPTGRVGTSARTEAIKSDQVKILQELQTVHAPHVQAFHLINAIGATVSQAEAAHLRANPVVRAVVNDYVVKPPAVQREQAGTAAANGSSQPLAAACGANGKTITEPEALQVTNDYFDDPTTPSAQKLATGKGVTVGFIAEGIDIHNPDFIRPDGSSVFTDYQDFNGDGPNAPTGGGESFGDASSIAAQGRRTYDVSKYAVPGQRMGTCNIRVLGMAPGASLMGLKVFGAFPDFSTVIVQAVQYAVDHGVNILSESLGHNTVPDPANDPFILANDAAVADGVSVVTSTGDAASNGTIGTPSTDPNVIAAGATTTLRIDEQLGYPGTGRGTGWVNNQLASLSSGGISSNGDKTIDVVAPGDGGWAVCTPDLDQYADCSDLNNKPSPLDFFGGTSESAPLTAGEAALVIQAYRQAHNDVNPSPAQVKQIIESTATDLHLPASDQGSGLINALRAVQMALSINDGNGLPKRQGDTLLFATHPNTPNNIAGPLTAQDLPGTPETFPVQLTNQGTVPSFTQVSVRTLQYAAPQITDVTLSPSSTKFVDALNRTAYKTERTFNVDKATQYLKAAIAWDTVKHSPADVARLTLYEPDGKLVQYSRPQGAGTGYGYVEVHDPQPGNWRAVIWTVKTSAANDFFGTVHFGVSQEKFVQAGIVRPATVGLAPGYSTTIQVQLTMPSQPGDSTDEIVLTTTGVSGVHSTAIPVILRTLVPTNGSGGTFSGLLLGGNGRGGSPGQQLTYSFRVPKGLRDVDLGIKLNDSNYNLGAALVNPANQEIDAQSTVTGFDKDFNPTGYTNTLQFFRRDPEAGIWKLVLVVNQTTSGRQTEEPFTGTITFNGVRVSAPDLPKGGKLTAGQPVVVPVTVKNTGNETEQFFADARLNGSQTYLVYSNEGPKGELPYAQGSQNYFAVPTETTDVNTWAETVDPSVPFNMELSLSNGTTYATGQGPDLGFGLFSPDVMGTRFADPLTGFYGNVASYSAPEVPAGFWFATTALQGPFDDNGAPASKVLLAATINTQPFDSNSTSTTGDLWQNVVGSNADYTPLTLKPGQTGTIKVAFIPKGTVGSAVHGFLYIDTLQLSDGVLTTGNGDELIKLPYSYAIAAGT